MRDWLLAQKVDNASLEQKKMNSKPKERNQPSEIKSGSEKFKSPPFNGPLVIYELIGLFNTTFGLTHCPGRNDRYYKAKLWARNLSEDFLEIRNWGADALISLNETQEFKQLGVPEFPQIAQQQNFDWYHLPIHDFSAPGSIFEDAWLKNREAILRHIDNGSKIIIHCAAGLGRTGTFTAKLLTKFGWDPQMAINEVRRVRPGAIERQVQERYIFNEKTL